MTDAEIIKVNECKTLAEGEKIKAIYPHIVVGGQTEKPCYSIQWYDIEKQTMLDGYASYKLEFVKKWLQENFEEIEFGIGDLINRQRSEIERLRTLAELGNMRANDYRVMRDRALKAESEIERLQSDNSSMQATLAKMSMGVEQAKAEAIKEFAERLKNLVHHTTFSSLYGVMLSISENDFDNLVKEMVGDTE